MNEKSVENEIAKIQNKEQLILKIKEQQKLTDIVVAEFLKSKGKLANKDFARRFEV